MENSFLDSLKVDPKPESMVEEFLRIAEILKKEGIDISKVRQKTGGRTNPRWTVLGDISLDNVDMEMLFNKYPQLKRNYPIGSKINEIHGVLRGNSKGYKVNQEEMLKLQEIFERKKSANKELLEVLRIIKEDFNYRNEDIKDLALRSKGKGITLGQLYYDAIISSKTRDKLKDMGYEHDFPLGQRIIRARRILDGKVADSTLNDQEKQELKGYIGLSRTYSRGNR